MAIHIKPGVQILPVSFLRPEVMRIPFVAQLVAADDYEVTITSGCEGTHRPGSKHYTGNAFDIRARDYPNDPAVWAVYIQKALGSLYWVGYEPIKVHIHIQYNK